MVGIQREVERKKKNKVFFSSIFAIAHISLDGFYMNVFSFYSPCKKKKKTKSIFAKL